MKIEKEKEEKKGIFRRLLECLKTSLEWLKTSDEYEIEDGEINIKAFKGEDKKIIDALNGTAKRVDHTASTTFTDKTEKRAATIKGMKAEVETPDMKEKGKKNQIIENYLEQ